VQQKVQRKFKQIEINYCNLKTPKVGKTWNFIFATVDTLKQPFLLQQGHKSKTQIKLLSSKGNENKTERRKYYRLASRKRFLYSHVARLFTLLIQEGQVS
jgi:hypothetical protein